MPRTLSVAALMSAVFLSTTAAQRPSTEPPAVHPGSHVVVPGTRGMLATIQGNALNSVNNPLPDAIVRLRNVRTGHVVGSATTDKTGLFVFKNIEPGSYIVELMGRDQTVLAASQIINIEGSETMSTLVKLPLNVPFFAGLLGSAPTALTVTSVAIASGVLAATVTGEPSSARR